jgi:hypothetical protein
MNTYNFTEEEMEIIKAALLSLYKVIQPKLINSKCVGYEFTLSNDGNNKLIFNIDSELGQKILKQKKSPKSES